MSDARTWKEIRTATRRLLVGLAVIAVLVPLIAAFEAHTVNVKAHIENALEVDPNHIDFGVVFPQEELEADFTVRLSESFMTQERATDVFYRLLLELKPIPSSDPSGPIEYYDDLRPYIEVTKTVEADIDALHFSELGNWWFADPTDPSGERLRDLLDLWRIDFYVPCIEGSVGRDYEGPVAPYEGDYGADIRVEVFGLSYGNILHKVMSGDRVVPTNEEVEWTFYIVVKNDFDYAMTDLVVTDHFDAPVSVDESYSVEFAHGSPGWTYQHTTNHSGRQDRIRWTIDELAPADRAVLMLTVRTKPNPAGRQEFTSPGEHTLNSGACLKWLDDTGSKQSTSTPSLSVTAYEP